MPLIFVYNAQSTPINKTLSYAHKLLSPKTYACDLCQLTHANLGERKAWTHFKKNSPLDFVFYHADEFEAKYRQQFNFPVVLNSTLEVILTREKIGEFNAVGQLITYLQERF